MFKRIPGTKDILPEECLLWQKLEIISRKIFSVYNYSEIRPPLIEDAKLFNRSLGEFTEIVQKQMFLIKNQEDLYALRPEGTASVVRAYIENNLDKQSAFQKLYYIGPMFRLERPQKGRLRQFHHIGVEALGSFDPGIDVEAITLSDHLLKAYGINDYEIKLNSLGCNNDKKLFMQELHKDLSKNKDGLCPDCKIRLEGNVLRILDCKNESCKTIVSKLNIQNQHLCQDCLGHFSEVKKGLDYNQIKYTIEPCLVRGLDYYTRTVFEIKHSLLGAQDAIGAGGRYDNLIKELGGEDKGAVGFAFGIERLLLVTSHQSAVSGQNLVYIIALGEKAKEESLKLLSNLRKSGIAADTDYENKSLKAAMRKASDLKANFVLILGENELNKSTIMLKDMLKSTQEEIPINILIDELNKKLGK